MGPEDRPLTGFSWRGGCERDTTGILAWSEVLLVDTPSGEKVSHIHIQSCIETLSRLDRDAQLERKVQTSTFSLVSFVE